MKPGGFGLQGKFVLALLVAAALPFLVGLVVFESTGYRLLLGERGKVHLLQARMLARALDLAAKAQGENLRTFLTVDSSLARQLESANRSHTGRPPDEVALETRRIEELWPSLPPEDHRLVAVLRNPAADSLRAYCAAHPACAEILAADSLGRLAVATGKSTDYDQSDEEWWQTGIALAPGRQLTGPLRFDASSAVFSLDLVMPLHDSGTPSGVVKMSVDVTSLFAHLGFDGEAKGERWEIVLPDGRILASSSRNPDHAGGLPPETMTAIRGRNEGWEQIQSAGGEPRLAGFVAMGRIGDQTPNAYILFSSRRDDVVGPLQSSFLRIGIAAATVLGVCALAGFLIIRQNVLKPLDTLGKAARSIAETAKLRKLPGENDAALDEQHRRAERELEHIQSIRTGDEVEALAGDLAIMTSRVLRYQRELESEVAAKTSVIREDLELAREFQQALLPATYPVTSTAAENDPLRLQFAHFYQPAATVGGDFFDIIELGGHRTGVLIADVMGHGARSALVTAILRALVRHHSREAASPGAFLTEINRHLREVVERSGQTLFVTAFLLVLDTQSCTASWAVAGHPPPLRARRGTGKLPKPLWDEPPRQPALALIPDAVFETRECPLRSGDVFLLYTDGAVEAENAGGSPFGQDRLIASFDEALDGPMAAMPAKIVCEVAAWQKRRHYDDDVCLVAIEAVTSPQAGN